jgi:hypothetical protein
LTAGPLADLDAAQYARLRDDLVAAESTGLEPKLFDPLLSPYLEAAGIAAAWDTPPRSSASRCWHRRRDPRRRKLKIEVQSGLGFRVIRR